MRAANNGHQRSKSSPSNQGKANLASSSRGRPFSTEAVVAFFKELLEKADPVVQQGKVHLQHCEKYLKEEVDSEQIWVIGHISFLIHFALYFFGFGTSSGSTFPLVGLFSLWTWEAFYRRACYSLLVSYSIVNHKQFMLLKSSKQSTESTPFSFISLLNDANVLYLCLTLWMTLIAEPFSVALYTMFIYSFYHVAHFFSSRAAAGSPLARGLVFLQPAFKYQTQVTLLCAHLEILGVFVLFIRLLSGSTSILSFALYLQFIRFQYAASGRTRLAFKELDALLVKNIVENASMPPAIKVAYSQVTGLLAKGIPEFKKREA